MPLLRTASLLALAAAALTTPSRATAQTASYSYTGTSCTSGRLVSWGGGVPFQALTLPRLGQSLDLQTEGSTSYPMGVRRRTFLLTGTSNTSTGGVTLPVDISTLFPGQPVCGVLRTSDEVVLDVPFNPQWDATVVIRIPIPNNPSLLGTTIHQQVLSVELNTFGPFFRGITLSRGGTATIGR